MKRIILFIGLILLASYSFAQLDKLKDSPIYIDGDILVVGINAKTTDAELLDIRLKLMKFTSVRFIEFDVIRLKSKNKKEEGDISFISMEVDCRDGFIGRISHSFEEGDKDIYGFYRDYSKKSRVAFFIGNLSEEDTAFQKENKGTILKTMDYIGKEELNKE